MEPTQGLLWMIALSTIVIVYEKTRLKTQLAIFHNAHNYKVEVFVIFLAEIKFVK